MEFRGPGELFEVVGGRRLHAVISGTETNRRPVVLEAGLTAMSSCWAWVQQELSLHTKVLSYDRAGLGWSDPSGAPKDAKHIADDLHALLEAARFPKPFVFVGHSMGAIFGRAYASLYPHDLAGFVMVDASHPEQVERSPDIKWALRRFFWFLKTTPYMASCGMMKIAGDLGLASRAPGLSSMHQVLPKEIFSSTQHMRATVREAEEWFNSTAQVRDRRLGNLPLITISAQEKCMNGWMELQKELTSISTHSQHVIFDGATHLSILTNRDQARKVAQSILTLL